MIAFNLHFHKSELMDSAFSIARYILKRDGNLPSVKFQKLVYYVNAWSMVWTNEEAVEGEFQAWRLGPVLPSLYRQGTQPHIKQFPGRATVEPRMAKVIDSVLNFYGEFTTDELVELTHREHPWMEARRGVMPHESSNNVISNENTREYYLRTEIPALQFSEAYKRGLRTFIHLPIEVVLMQDDDAVDAGNHENWLKTGVGELWASSSE